MGLKIDNGVSQYAVPDWITLRGHPFSMRVDTEPKAFGHGGILTGDNKANAKEIELSGTTDYYATRAIHDATMRALVAAFLGGKKLVIDDAAYINFVLSEFDHYYEELMDRRMSSVEIVLVATDPFMYAVSETTVTTPINESPAQFMVNNPGLEVYPVITITAADANTAFSLKNLSDGNRTFGYTDAQFTSGKVLVVDSVAGTVKRDGTNTINNMGGTFLKLLPGDNVFEYTGGACTIDITYRERWL